MKWLFGAYSLWRDALLSLDTVGRALVLPQDDMTDFVDFPMGGFTLSEWMGNGVEGR